MRKIDPPRERLTQADRYILNEFLELYLLDFRYGRFTMDEATGGLTKAMTLLQAKGIPPAVKYMRSILKKRTPWCLGGVGSPWQV
jgi:hypothetical protein